MEVKVVFSDWFGEDHEVLGTREPDGRIRVDAMEIAYILGEEPD